MMLEMAIADFYAVVEVGIVIVRVDGDDYYIVGDDLPGSGMAYDKEEIEGAQIITIFEVQYVTDV